MKKTIFFWLYFIVSIVLAVYFAVRIITNQMGRGTISQVKHISITSTDKDFDMEPIRVAIGLTNATQIKSIDLHQINNRIMGVPGVKNASTKLLPNGTISVKVQQHHIAAQWSDGEYFYPLSMDGTTIDKPSTQRDDNTIVFRGKLPENLTKTTLTTIINDLSQIADYVDYITMIENRRWNIYTKNGTVIYLPEENPTFALNKINILNQTHKLLSRKIEIIDMRDNARILVKTKK